MQMRKGGNVRATIDVGVITPPLAMPSLFVVITTTGIVAIAFYLLVNAPCHSGQKAARG